VRDEGKGKREKGKRKVGVFLERGFPPLTPNFSREGKREKVIRNWEHCSFLPLLKSAPPAPPSLF
jgi:hypothetical protein